MNETKNYSITKSGAVILEGGANRGVFTAGALDFLMEQEYYIPHVIGVSAGACNALDYVSRQIGRTRDCMIVTDEKNRYVNKNIKTIVEKKALLDMDMVFERYPYEIFPFDFDTYFASPQTCELVVTNCETGRAEYLDDRENKERLLAIGRASSSMPIACPMVEIDGNEYVDGGVADSALGEMLGELGSVEDLDLFPEETARDPALSADLQDKLRTFGDSLKVTKAGTSVLTLDGRSVPVTNYDIDFSKKQLTRLCRAFCDAYEIDFTVNMGVKMSTDTVIGGLIDSVRTPLHVSVDGDGMVRAWEMTTRESGTDTTVRILLAGEENPWNRIEVWTAEDDAEPEVLFVCGLTGQNGLLTLAVGDETGSYGLQLVLDDAAQSLTARLSTGFGAEKLDLLTMNYGTEDGGAQLGVTLDLPDQLDAKATLDLHWTALETQPEALSDSPVGLFDLSEDELTALEKSIGAQIARLLYGEDMTTGETDAVLTGTWKMQVDLTPNLLDALNDALGLDLQMDDPTVMTMLVTFGEDGSYHMDYDAKALREELNALEDALCEKYPDQEAMLKQAFAGLQLDVDGSSGTYTASNGILYLTQSGEDWEDILYYSVEDNKLYLTPPQDEESGDWGGMFGSEYPMVFERVD